MFICYPTNPVWSSIRGQFFYIALSFFIQLPLEVRAVNKFINAQPHDGDEPGNISVNSFGGDFSMQGFGNGSKLI